MARYRLMTKDAGGNKTGPHLMGPMTNGQAARVVRPGELVESDEPLDRLFRNKFVRIKEAMAAPAKTTRRRQK